MVGVCGSKEIRGERKMNIYEKLSNITTDLKAVAKNLQVGEGKYQYKAVSEIDVLNAVKPLEAKYKVYSYPCKREVIESGIIESVNYKGELKKNQFLRIETTYRFVNIEEPTEFIETTTYGDGIDSQDKAPGKAMTYGDKYALLKAYKIMTGDDPDVEASDQMVSATTKKSDVNADKKQTKENYRQELIDYCKANGLDMTAIAKKYKLNANSKPNEFLDVLAKLKEGK